MTFDTERFIMEIKNRPSLWDTGSSEHSDRNLKLKCWEEIVDIFKEDDEMTNKERRQFGEALQKKWKSIRGCFTRELIRQKKLKSGFSAGPRKSEYVFFKQLKFLENIGARDPDPLTVVTVALEEVGEDCKQNREVKCPKRRRIDESSISDDDVSLNKSIDKKADHCIEQDEDKLFLLSLLSTLKKVPQQRKMATKIKIMSLLDEATQSIPEYRDS